VGTLYLVATPIGNLEDVTLRALRVLGEAELVLAEDTRRTRVLLERHSVDARPRSLHAHNEAARTAQALGVLAGGGDVALVSDAGTPLLSDPGERLLAAALDDGHEVTVVPGASAALAALTLSGLPVLPCAVLGFPPRRAGARRVFFQAWSGRAETLVLFESPRRLGRTLAEAAEILGPRRGCVARELTKLHEEAVRGTLPELAARFEDGARGEVTLVIAGAEPEPLDDAEVEARIVAGVREGRTSREIAAQVAADTGAARREVYARAVAARERERR
jgi:16S rRNA (cytidine1402-2'-O)-methyltransferase